MNEQDLATCNGSETHSPNESGHSHDPFYSNAADYWETVPANIEGMLGGFGHISSTDIGSSFKFMRSFIIGEKAKTGTTKALDCGAGIGRITKLLLTTVFDSVDLLEQNPKFVEEAPAYLGKEKAAKVEKFICSGLQAFTPEENQYDVIWIQWVMGHLTDDDFVDFFKRSKKGLKENGVFIVKENISFGDEPEFDAKDSSYTRPRENIMQLFEKSGLNLLKEEKQKHFPKELYEVRMFALQ